MLREVIQKSRGYVKVGLLASLVCAAVVGSLSLPTAAEAGTMLTVGGLIGGGIVAGYVFARRQLHNVSIESFKKWEEARKGSLTAENETLRAKLAEAEAIAPLYRQAISDLARNNATTVELHALLGESIDREVGLTRQIGKLTGDLSEVKRSMQDVAAGAEEMGAQVKVNALAIDGFLAWFQRQPVATRREIRERLPAIAGRDGEGAGGTGS